MTGAAARAAVIATGDELVCGKNVDTNSGRIASRLLDLGIETDRFVVLGDDEAALGRELEQLCATHDVVVVTGGLGPTLDDVSRHAVARAAGRELVLSQPVLDGLKTLFAGSRRPWSEANARQALFPAGAEILENPHGTAPGFALRLGRAQVFVLPGPPREMEPMLGAHVLPRLAALARAAGPPPERASFFLFGLPESALADRCGAWMARDADPLVGVTARGGVLSVSMRSRGPVATRAAEFRERFREWIFSETSPDLALAVGNELIARRIAVATAESCTGGLLSERLTSVPGISAVLDAGYVTYSNRAKVDLLGVAPALIEAHGAVSAEVAGAMALGAARRSRARLAVSITGIAGPDGGTPEKPVGLVWFGVAADDAVRAEERRFPARGRDLVRDFAASTALDLLRRALRDLGGLARD